MDTWPTVGSLLQGDLPFIELYIEVHWHDEEEIEKDKCEADDEGRVWIGGAVRWYSFNSLMM